MIGRTGATITSFFPSRAGSSTVPAAERSAARVLKFGSARAVATSCKPIEGEEKVRGTSGNGLQAEVRQTYRARGRDSADEITNGGGVGSVNDC